MIRHHQDTEDVLLRVFQKAFAALNRFEGDRYFKSWLFRIGHNEAINMIKKRKRHQDVLVSTDHLHLRAREKDGLHTFEANERARALHEAILTLPDAEREVVLLRLEVNMPFREIAEQTDAPLGTVLARMHNAKKRLRTKLQQLEKDYGN